MTQISFLGAIASVGASGVLVDTGTEKIVLDYGTKIQEMPPIFPIPVQGKVDAVILSHPHLDHCGGIPIFCANGSCPPVYSIDVAKPLTELLLLDSVKISHEEGIELPFTKNDVRQTIKNFVPVRYRTPFNIHKTRATLFDAGHIPGSAMPFLDCNGKTILYTGDFKTTHTRLLEKADTELPRVEALITESTYSDREHLDRKTQEKELINVVRDTLAVDGTTLVAGFAVGRLDEILLTLDAYGIDYPIYVDGMAKKAITIINQHRNLLRNPNALDKALEKVDYVANDRMRRRIMRRPCVILTTSGMLSGGPIAYYLKKLYNDRNSSLVLTGFQVEGSPGKTLLETGRYITEETNVEVQMLVKRLDFSSHLGKRDLFDFVKHVNPKKVFCIHGDHTEEFAQELRQKGFDAIAPLANNRIFNV